MRRLKQKLKSKRGESLVETLVAILILSLSSAMLAMMCSMAVKINRQASLANAILYREISIAEQGAGTTKKRVVLEFSDTSVNIDGVLFTGAAGELRSFALEAKEGE